MAYKTINISLRESMKQAVECVVRDGHYSSTSDFIRDLIRDHLEEKRIERLVIEGLNDVDISELRADDFKGLKRMVMDRLKAGKVVKDE